MKRLSCMILLCLMHVLTSVVSAFTLNVEVTPAGGGTLNTGGGTFEEGESIRLRASAHTGFVFEGWYEGEELLSESDTYDFTMPARDTRLTAVYRYDPEVPADPEQLGVRYMVTVKSRPEGGGTFNTVSASVEEGGSVRLYAYTNTGFRFVRWEDADGNVVADANEFNYVMPHGGATIYGIFEFDPAPPSNPAKNYWNKELGELIIDDFTPGNLNWAVSDAIGNSGREEVTMITVSGVMNNNDFGVANNYGSCTLLDLGRVTGITEIPSYSFDYTTLESVTLPATIEKIGMRAFAECAQLSSLTLYSMTPPLLESDVFNGVPEGLTVYVPAAAIAQYLEADGWKDFTILPITEDLRSITISLPEGTDPGVFSRMWLELTNTKNGQRMHYVMTDRSDYTFSNLMRNTSWKVELRNERGDVFGSIDNVEVKDDDLSVKFETLSVPHTVSLSVKTPDGEDVTDLTRITWTDVSGNYVSQSASVSGLPEGMELSYSLDLPQELTMLYVAPSGTRHVVAEGDNAVVCVLAGIPEVTLTGIIRDSSTGSPLPNSIVSASQTFGGKYTKSVSGKTDKTGSFSLELLSVPTSLTASASDYVSSTVVCDTLMNGEGTVTLPDMALRPISGAVITLGFTYKVSDVAGSEEAEVRDWYDDISNISYSIVNKTTGNPIGQFNVQYPTIVLLEEVAPEDVLEITASSIVSAFSPVKTEVVIDEFLKASAVFDIVEPGRIQASFNRNSNAAVVASLYDSNGKLLKTYSYSNSSLKTGNLQEGKYTLVTMGESNFFNTIYELAKLSDTGLVSGVDYIASEVDVFDGVISEVNIEEVPTLDEGKLYYTGSGTSFTVNKPSIVTGNYLTLTGRVDFKGAYSNKVGNVSLLVDLPESCSFVENSVMVGNSTASYTLNGNRLTIPLARYTDRVRFCVIPTLGGDYSPSAFVKFDLDGQTMTQPIGSAKYTAKDLSITVPKIVAKTSIPVSGTAVGKSTVEIYDGNMLIGQTQSLANGTWSTTCELVDPYNLSTHQIYAKVTSKEGLELRSETAECTYDMNALRVSKVTLYHDNPEMRKTYEVVFDFLNPTQSTDSYIYYIYNKNFTFTIDFTNNDPEKISDVILYVKLGGGEWHPLPATYDSTKGMWYASSEFGNMYDGNIPVNVGVDFKAKTDALLDAEFFSSKFNSAADTNAQIATSMRSLDELIEMYELAKQENDETRMSEIMMQIINLTGRGQSDSSERLDDDAYNKLVAEADALNESLLGVYDNLLNSSVYASDIVGEAMDGITIAHTSGLTVDDLLEKGFERIELTDGNAFYTLSDGDVWQFVDFNSDLYITYKIDKTAKTRSSDDGGQGWLDQITSITDTIKSVVEEIQSLFDSVVENLYKANEANGELLEQAQKKYATRYLDGLSKSEIADLEKDMQKYVKRIKQNDAIASWLEKNVGQYMSGYSTASKVAGKAFSLFALIQDGIDAYNDVSTLIRLRDLVEPPCDKAKNEASELKSDINGWINKAGAYYIVKLGADVAELGGFSFGLSALIPTGGTSVSAIAAAVAVLAANIAADYFFGKSYENAYERFCKRYRELFKLCDREPCDGETPCPPTGDDNGGTGGNNGKGNNGGNDSGHGQESGCGDSKPGIDPSGFVYEAVPGNRVEGVTATIFYKEMVEDMYGDLHENIVKWDAAEYAQENPLFTDEDGNYRWDVPQGLWQVKFEKEGYETTYSDWLPVPPPQLDVNIAMKQNVQPNIKSARAFEDAVEVEFDKYMQPALLNTDNIVVLSGESPISGTVKLLNEEKSDEESDETFASKVRFVADAPFSADEVTLLVKNRVKSYADVRMQDDFMQSFGVESEIRKIECDSVVDVAYGGSRIVKVTVLPATASVGKTLNVRATSLMVASCDVESVVIAEDGSAEIPVNGELPGTGALILSVDGYDITATTIVNVKEDYKKTAAPRANIASGSTVEKGTEITLACSTEGATIVYTLDGSCPCDDTAARTVYDGTPIVVNESVTIKAIAYAPDMYESDIVEFKYYVDDSGVGVITSDSDVRMYPLPMRETLNISAGDGLIMEVMFTNISGATVVVPTETASMVSVDVSTLPAGIYIVVVKTDMGDIVRKVMKVK